MLDKTGYDILETDNGDTAIDVIKAGEDRLMLGAMP